MRTHGTSREKEARHFDADVAIIGGGASGLTAAIAAAGSKARVVVLEQLARVGKKLLATGNGRCNLTNIGDLEGRFHGGEPFAMQVLRAFDVDKTLAFFRALGVEPVTLEDNKVYPASLQASSVLDLLRAKAEEMGVVTLCDCPVRRVEPIAGGFRLETADRRMTAQRVILCAGGRASPSLGSDGSGFSLLRALGHRITPTFPSIVQINTDTTLVRALKGIKIMADVTVTADGRQYHDAGEVLFTEYGLSGPPILQLSRVVSTAKGPVGLMLDLLPDYDRSWLNTELKRRRRIFVRRGAEELLTGLVHKRLGQTAMKAAGINPFSRPVASLTDQELRDIALALKAFSVQAHGARSFETAQVTAGGAEVSEFCSDSMESRRIPGLYAAGEVLNVDGDCGGFNLQWAWSSGFVAGSCAAHSLPPAHDDQAGDDLKTAAAQKEEQTD